MDILFLAFANQVADVLPTLQEEDDMINRLLSPRAKERHFLLHRESFVTVEKLPTYLTMYRDDLVLFLYSGHADRDVLLLGDGAAQAGGMAQMLGQCPNLRLVFLNGCSTQGQVARLLEAGVPVVLATSAPVNDRKATFFSIRFFEALQQQFTLREAFDMAKGALETAFADASVQQYRSAGFDAGEVETPSWGLYFSEKSEHVLDWKLPVLSTPDVAAAASFSPNQHLIDALFAALSPYNDEVRKLEQQARRGVQTPVPKKRMALLNALPAPLAEPLRKLMVPVEKENEGFDKVSEARLRQIAQAFTTSMELLCYTMMAELWDAYYETPALTIAPEQREDLRAFFRLSRTDRETYNMLPLIRTLRTVFEQNKISFFVEELRQIWQLTDQNPEFLESIQFLNGLRLQMRRNEVDKSDLDYLNKHGEVCLAYLYGHLGFMARYKLATIQSIDVEKYRHRRDPRYNHTTIMLHDLLGGFDVSEIHLDVSLDNRSILLLNEDTWEYLNLTPFVVDENAFRERTDVCKLFFFSHYLKAADTYCFKYVNKPDDPYLEISDARYPLVKEQFEAFADLLLQKPMPAV